MSEVWFRNPLAYIRECAELLVPNIIWDRGLLIKNRIDAQRHLELHYPSILPYRLMLCGDQGTAELRRGFTFANPFAVYPTWEYGAQTMSELEELLGNPVGMREALCKDKRLPPDERPVLGQEHRVVVIRAPDAGSALGRGFLRTLVALQQDYPEAIIHYHGTNSFRVAFGIGLAAADIEPRERAAKGEIWLGSGRHVNYELGIRFAQWVRLNGYTQGDLAVPRNRCMFNMKSAMWAAEHYTEVVKIKSTGTAHIDHDASTAKLMSPATTKRIYSGKAAAGDKVVCDSCSLATSCKYYRDGGVCVIPDTDSAKLAKLFRTRDSDLIIEAYGRVLEMQAERAIDGRAEEVFMGELNPEVTRILSALATGSERLAKLINPVLASAGSTRVGVFINQAASPTANAMAASVVAELEAQGIARSDITDDMLQSYLASRGRAIEAKSRDGD